MNEMNAAYTSYYPEKDRGQGHGTHETLLPDRCIVRVPLCDVALGPAVCSQTMKRRDRSMLKLQRFSEQHLIRQFV